MIGMDILQPVVVLLGWTMLVWAWMLITRIPALSAKGIKLSKLTGGTGRDAEGVVPDRVQWKAHNYNHLLEQPTVFYAAAIVLALVGQGDGVNAAIAWVYVAVRIAHSLWQATINQVMVRFALFVLSSLALVALVLHAALAVF
jgi:hypothetical protein